MIIAQNTTEQNTSRQKRKHIYALQDAASEILGEDHPVASCLRQTVSGAGGVAVVRTGETVSYHGLTTCQNAWLCPVCSRRILAEHRGEISQVLHAAHERGNDALFVTVTIEHHAGQQLEVLLDTMLAAWRAVFSGDRSGERQCLASVAGQIKALEVRFGRSHWHPHLHVLVLVDHAGMSADEAALLDEQIAAVIFSRYSKAVARRGMMASPAGYNCKKVDDLAGAVGKYVSKFEPTLEGELTGGGGKDGHLSYNMWQLLDLYTKDPNAKVYGRSVASIFKEYAAATHKRRQISFSRDLKKTYQVKEEKYLSEETPEVLTVIGGGLWSYICRHHKRVEVLEVAETGGVDALEDYLQVLWVKYLLEKDDTKRHKRDA